MKTTNLTRTPAHSIRDAMLCLEHNGVGIVVVVDETQRVVGLVSDGDLRRAILAHHRLEDPLGPVMHTDFVAAQAGVTEAAQLALLRTHGLEQLPLLDEQGRLVALRHISEFVPAPPVRVAPDPGPLHVVILAGGRGMRLRPLTERTPKPMLPVGDRPLLETVIRKLVAADLRRITIAVHYLADQIEEHFGDGEQLGAEIDYLHEVSPLGTAGAVALAAPPTGGAVLAMNADILTTLNFNELIADHRRRANAMSIALVPMDITIPYGVCTLEEHRVTRITEKPSSRYFANAGIYVVEPAALRHIPGGQRYDMPSLATRCIEHGLSVGGFPVLEFWRDIGRPADLEAANLEFNRHFGAGAGPPLASAGARPFTATPRRSSS